MGPPQAAQVSADLAGRPRPILPPGREMRAVNQGASPPMNPADAVPVASDSSILTMFWSAHIVVKAVMLGLFLASLWCWTIIFDKSRQ